MLLGEELPEPEEIVLQEAPWARTLSGREAAWARGDPPGEETLFLEHLDEDLLLLGWRSRGWRSCWAEMEMRRWRAIDDGSDSKSGRTDSKLGKGRVVFFPLFTWSGRIVKRLIFLHGGSIWYSK
jgi:hypothetical protein